MKSNLKSLTEKDKILHKGGGAVSVNGPFSKVENANDEGAAKLLNSAFEMRENGLYETGSLADKPICGPFLVAGTAVSNAKMRLGVVLQTLVGSTASVIVLVPFDILRDSGKLANLLEEAGVHMPLETSFIRKIAKYIYETGQQKQIIVLTQDGIEWVNVNGEEVPIAVLGKHVIAPENVDAIAIPSTGSPYEQHGDLDSWKERAKLFLTNNPVCIAVIAAALSAPLKALFHFPLLSLLIAGPSGSGKTTLARFVNSLFGHPNDPHGWSGTVNGLEALALRHTDAPLPLDELGEGNVREALTSVYRLANGVQKSRANTNGSLQEPAVLRTIVIGTGEITLAEHAATSNQKIRQGHEARMPTVWLDELFGAISSLNAFPNPESLIHAIDQLGRDSYGTVWLAYIESLITDFENCRCFMAKHKGHYAARIATAKHYASLSAFERRVLDGMTAWALAGEWAIWSMILPLPQHAVLKSVKHVYCRWLERTRSALTAPNTAIVTHFRDYFQRTRASRFVDYEYWARDDGAIDGYAYFTEKHTLYLMIPGVFNELCKKFGYQESLKALDEAGYLAYHKGGKTWQLRLGPERRRVRFIAIESRIIFDD